MNAPILLTVSEAARSHVVSESTLRRHLGNGTLTTHQVERAGRDVTAVDKREIDSRWFLRDGDRPVPGIERLVQTYDNLSQSDTAKMEWAKLAESPPHEPLAVTVVTNSMKEVAAGTAIGAVSATIATEFIRRMSRPGGMSPSAMASLKQSSNTLRMRLERHVYDALGEAASEKGVTVGKLVGGIIDGYALSQFFLRDNEPVPIDIDDYDIDLGSEPLNTLTGLERIHREASLPPVNASDIAHTIVLAWYWKYVSKRSANSQSDLSDTRQSQRNP